MHIGSFCTATRYQGAPADGRNNVPSTTAGIMWAMDMFAELVDGSGPLSTLRLDPTMLRPCVKPLGRTPSEAAIEQAFAAHVEVLVPKETLARVRGALVHFAGLSFIDESHRLAARTALALLPIQSLREGAAGRDAPSLYPIFRAQVLEMCSSAAV